MEKNLQNFHLQPQSVVGAAGLGERKHLCFQKLVDLLPSNRKRQSREVSVYGSAGSPRSAPVCVTVSLLPTYTLSLYDHFL